MSYVKLNFEESPRYENAPVTTPYRISTIDKYMAIQGVRMAPAPAHIDRSDELRGIEGSVPRILDMFEPEGNITVRAYPDDIAFLLLACGFNATRTAGGATVAGGESTTATGVNALNSATVNVASTDGFPATGSFIMGGVATTYTGITSTSFTGCGNHAATVGGEVINDQLPTGVSKWVYTKRSSLQAKTFQAILAYTGFGNDTFIKGQGFGVTNLTLNAAGALSADLAGLTYQRIADPVVTPSYTTQAIPPFRRADMGIKWLTGSGETDDFSFAVANPLNRRDSFAPGFRSFYPDKMFHADDRVVVTGTIPKYGLDPDDVDALLAASIFSAKAAWRSDKVIAATSVTYKLYVDMPSCQIIGGGPEDLGNRRRFGGSFDFWAAWDETAGYDVKFTVVNGLNTDGALETYV